MAPARLDEEIRRLQKCRDVDSPRKRPSYTMNFCNSRNQGGLRYGGVTRRCRKSLLRWFACQLSTKIPAIHRRKLLLALALLYKTDQVSVEEDASIGQEDKSSPIYEFLYPDKEELPDDKEMTIFDHLEELRERIFVSVLAVGAAITGCFAFSKDLIVFLEAPVKNQGVRFLQIAPGEFFFTTLKVSGYCGLLLGSPVILYEIIAFVLPGLTRAERRFLGPIVFGSSLLFYAGLAFSYWYFEFVLVLMFSTGLSFQVHGSESLHLLGLFTRNLTFVCLVGLTGSSNSVTPGTSRGGVWRSNAFNMEICGGGYGGCSSCGHALDRPSHSNAPSNAASGAILGWCVDGQAHSNTITGETVSSKLSLVDLAGSEGLTVEDDNGDHVTDLLHVTDSISALGDVFLFH
ncbi:hypothetical protein HA466_0137310 [Hirschfeldia incana]|nr:hypothetical protein HA466_0137310 [Hirschfeldia incana]